LKGRVSKLSGQMNYDCTPSKHNSIMVNPESDVLIAAFFTEQMKEDFLSVLFSAFLYNMHYQ